MKKRGGKRENAGRPKGTISDATRRGMEIKDILSRKLREEIEPIIDAQIKQAKKGDVQQFKNMLEQVIGKPVESVKLSGDQDAPILIDITKQLSKAYGQDDSD